MIVRFDGKAVQNTVERKNGAELIGVEGDPATRRGGVSEADAIVAEARSKVEVEVEDEEKNGGTAASEGDNIEKVIKETAGEDGPELSPTATEGKAVA